MTAPSIRASGRATGFEPPVRVAAGRHRVTDSPRRPKEARPRLPNIISDPKLGLIATGRAPVSELEDMLHIKLLTEGEVAEIDTLGGLVFSMLGRVPARGELIRHATGVEFEVLDADPRRVKKLKIHVPKTVSAAAQAASAETKS